MSFWRENSNVFEVRLKKLTFNTFSPLKLPGGLQMASMVNQDLLNARDLAIQGGHLELAKLLRANSDQPQPRDYEFPVLKPFTPPTSPMSEASSYYDVPRPVEQFYVVPPPPRPVDAKMKKDTSTSYVPMLPKGTFFSKVKLSLVISTPFEFSRQNTRKSHVSKYLKSGAPQPKKMCWG